jgi:hypothetical protein
MVARQRGRRQEHAWSLTRDWHERAVSMARDRRHERAERDRRHERTFRLGWPGAEDLLLVRGAVA